MANNETYGVQEQFDFDSLLENVDLTQSDDIPDMNVLETQENKSVSELDDSKNVKSESDTVTNVSKDINIDKPKPHALIPREMFVEVAYLKEIELEPRYSVIDNSLSREDLMESGVNFNNLYKKDLKSKSLEKVDPEADLEDVSDTVYVEKKRAFKREVKFRNRIRADIDQSMAGVHVERDKTKGVGLTGNAKDQAQQKWTVITLENFNRLMDKSGNQRMVDYKTEMPSNDIQFIGKNTPDQDVPVFKAPIIGMMPDGKGGLRQAYHGENGKYTHLAVNKIEKSEAPPFDRNKHKERMRELSKKRNAKNSSNKGKSKSASKDL